MGTYAPLPLELDRRFQAMALANESLMLSHQYDQAREGFKRIYELLYQEQPPDGRYHKGYPLHQIGITFILSGKAQEALQYFILAYIEDLLTQEQGQEDRADDMPAGKTLRGAYKVQDTALLEFKTIVQHKKKRGQVIRDPNDVFNELAKGRPAPKVAEPVQTPDVGREKRKPGKFKSEWAKRVFVGGSYTTHLAELNHIKKVMEKLGYDPVLAFEFDTPEKEVHHHALMLLHECNKAVFEISAQAGQLMEIERLRDYGIKPLIVCQAGARLSEMLEALLNSEGYQLKRYSTMDELEKLVREYLP